LGGFAIKGDFSVVIFTSLLSFLSSIIFFNPACLPAAVLFLLSPKKSTQKVYSIKGGNDKPTTKTAE